MATAVHSEMIRVLIVLLLVANAASAEASTQMTPVAQSKDGTSASGPLTNADVLRLVASGAGDDEIITTIQARDPRFDLRSRALVSLREQRVSKLVIAAMLGRTALTNAPSLTATVVTASRPTIPEVTGSAEPPKSSRPAALVVEEAAIPTTTPAQHADAFDLAAFRGTRRLLISANRIEYQAKDSQGRVQPDSFTATCDGLSERTPGRFERSLTLQLKDGRRYSFDVSKQALTAVMAALAEACGS